MFKRLSENQFKKIVTPLTNAKRQTRNEKEWYNQLRLLNNRIVNAQKKGYSFSPDAIPVKPSRITQKSLQYLSSLKGVKLYATAINPINASVSERERKRVEKELEKKDKEKPVDNKGDNTLGVALGTQKEDYPEVSYTSKIDASDITDKTSTQEQPEVTTVEKTEEEKPTSTTEEFTSYDLEYYERNPDRQYEDILEVDEGMTVIKGIYDELGVATEKISAELERYGKINIEIKNEARDKVERMLTMAIQEYGYTEVARRIQNSSESVDEIIKYILYAIYIDVDRTKQATDEGIYKFSRILAGGDVNKQMEYDFSDKYNI